MKTSTGDVMTSTIDGGWRILPMGDCCLMIELGQKIDLEINRTVQSIAKYLLDHPLNGVVDIVPAFTTVAIHYRPDAFAKGDLLPYQQLTEEIETILEKDFGQSEADSRVIDIPVCYGGEYGEDLDDVAAKCKLSPDEVIRIHGESPHMIFMLGFAPGFPYIGGLDPRLSLPRRQTPRTSVPGGSVAITGTQSAVYPMQLPGGWNLIGRTPLKLFDFKGEQPCLLQPGDRVRFVPISPEQFKSIQEQQS